MKKIVMALALGILGAAGAIGAGCGGDKCTTYQDDLSAKYEECGITVQTTTNSGATDTTCTEDDATLAECQDACLTQVNCACWKTPDGSNCAVDQKPYNDCINVCNANK
ncbi:MAG: hypothetical protein U0441_36085 [Polyangiaceae bacterium]